MTPPRPIRPLRPVGPVGLVRPVLLALLLLVFPAPAALFSAAPAPAAAPADATRTFAEGNLLVRWESGPIPEDIDRALAIAVPAALEVLPPPPTPATVVLRPLPAPSRWSRLFSRNRPQPNALHVKGQVLLSPVGDLDALAFRLAHEFSHELVACAFPAPPPLWLDEGLAQFVATRAAAAAARSIGRTSVRVPPENLAAAAYSLDALTALADYPADPDASAAFYWQAEILVTRLHAALGPRAFLDYLRALSTPSPPPWQLPLRRDYYFNDADFTALERHILPK